MYCYDMPPGVDHDQLSKQEKRLDTLYFGTQAMSSLLAFSVNLLLFSTIGTEKKVTHVKLNTKIAGRCEVLA